jgi:Cytochrome c7 and related cytochrome c
MMKALSLMPRLLALLPLAALAAEPAPPPSPPSGPPPVAAVQPPGLATGGAEPGAAAAAPAPPACSLETGVDRMAASGSCTGCHTGVSGNFEHGGHRVEVPYEPYGKELRAKPEERGVNVVLPGGRITCLTCHDPKSKLPDHLAANIGGPVEKRLCTACHLFD